MFNFWKPAELPRNWILRCGVNARKEYAILCVHVLCETWEMVISRRRFAENLKEMHGIKKKHVKGVQNFCFCQLGMQILWRRRCSRVVDLKLPMRDETQKRDIKQVDKGQITTIRGP